MRNIFIFILTISATQLEAQTNSTALKVWAMCGPSQGKGYFFKDEIWNPEGPDWQDDGISNGQITLVNDGKNIDIIFGDAARASGYRDDGAEVALLHFGDKFIRVGAFSELYVDIYNFDRLNSEVAWSSNKSGPFAGKVAVYRSGCKFVK